MVSLQRVTNNFKPNSRKYLWQYLCKCSCALCLPVVAANIALLVFTAGTYWLVDEIVEPRRWVQTTCTLEQKTVNTTTNLSEDCKMFDTSIEYIARLMVSYDAPPSPHHLINETWPLQHHLRRVCGTGDVCWREQGCITIDCSFRRKECWEFISDRPSTFDKYQLNQTYPCWYSKEDSNVVVLEQPYTRYAYPAITTGIGLLFVLISTIIAIRILRKFVEQIKHDSTREIINSALNLQSPDPSASPLVFAPEARAVMRTPPGNNDHASEGNTAANTSMNGIVADDDDSSTAYLPIYSSAMLVDAYDFTFRMAGQGIVYRPPPGVAAEDGQQQQHHHQYNYYQQQPQHAFLYYTGNWRGQFDEEEEAEGGIYSDVSELHSQATIRTAGNTRSSTSNSKRDGRNNNNINTNTNNANNNNNSNNKDKTTQQRRYQTTGGGGGGGTYTDSLPTVFAVPPPPQPALTSQQHQQRSQHQQPPARGRSQQQQYNWQKVDGLHFSPPN